MKKTDQSRSSQQFRIPVDSGTNCTGSETWREGIALILSVFFVGVGLLLISSGNTPNHIIKIFVQYLFSEAGEEASQQPQPTKKRQNQEKRRKKKNLHASSRRC
jgi:hypothetical protein